MRIIFGLVLVIGVAIAGFAVKFAMDRFGQYQDALAQQREAIVEMTTVYVMNRQVRYGERLGPDDVRAIRWPADSVPFGAYTAMEELFPEDEDELRTVLRVMEPDEPILSMKITAPGEDAGVASRLEDGHRAFSLRVDVLSGVSGFIRPGDRVDVYWTGNGRNGDSVTRLIRSNIDIIALDQIDDSDRNNPIIARTITISAPPEEIAALTQAQASGSLSLALVGVDDDTVIEREVEVSADSLLGEREVQELVEGPRVCTVRMRRGGDLVEVPVPCLN